MNDGKKESDYMSSVFPGWEDVVSEVRLTPGAPLLLILCSSALRAVQLNRLDLDFFMLILLLSPWLNIMNVL